MTYISLAIGFLLIEIIFILRDIKKELNTQRASLMAELKGYLLDIYAELLKKDKGN